MNYALVPKQILVREQNLDFCRNTIWYNDVGLEFLSLEMNLFYDNELLVCVFVGIFKRFILSMFKGTLYYWSNLVFV